MCELFDQENGGGLWATSSIRPPVNGWWVSVLTAESCVIRWQLIAEIRPPGSLLQQRENEMVNLKGSTISTSKGFN